jgi:hypothetical protein
MSQTNQPNQPGNSSQPGQASRPGRSSTRTLGIVGLVLVAILSLGFAGYSALNPQVRTVTQQLLVTNTQSVTNTQTVINTKTATSATTITSISTTSVGNVGGFGYNPYYPYYEQYPYPNYQTCGAYCPPPSSTYLNNYYSCNLNTPAGANGTVQCYGYLYQDSNGCVELVVPISNPYYFESPVYQYYGLRNLPSNAPAMGTWVIVNGQLNQGSNTGSSGAVCPSNYVNVTSISQ